MRAPAILLVSVLLATASFAWAPALAQDQALPVEASFVMDPGPSWQTAENGSWAKHSSPVIADLDPLAGNGQEIVVGSLGGKLYALRVVGGELRKIWSRDVGTAIDSSPAVADLDGDGRMEVVVGAGNEFRPQNSGVHIFAADGSNHRFWSIPGAPGVANHVGVFSTPAIGDVSGDGRPDVVFGSFNQRIYARDATGRDLPGWDGGRQIHDTIWSSPALADVDGNRDLEIVIGTDLGGGDAVHGCPKPTRGMVVIFEGDGSFRPGWPKCMDTPIWSTPAVVDVTGDGVLDVFVGTNNYIENGVNVGEPWKVYAWDASGRSLWTTSVRSGSRVFSSPALGDVDGDGDLELAVGSINGTEGETWLLEAATGKVLWSRDDLEGGCCVFMGSPILTDVDGDGRSDVVAAGGDARLHVWNASGDRLVRQKLGKTFFNSPAAGDVDGDGRIEIVAASARSGTGPRVGAVWVLGTSSSRLGPWPMYKRSADRRSAFGSGHGAPSTSPTQPPVTPARPRPAVRSTPSPSTSVAPSASPRQDPAPTVYAAPRAPVDATGHRNGGLRLIAIVVVGVSLLAVSWSALSGRRSVGVRRALVVRDGGDGG